MLDYPASIAFFDKMFGWLGYTSFWTLEIEYTSTYYMARYPFFHSYIGIQAARTGQKLQHADRATGVHHVALWARNRREVDVFYNDFLLPNNVPVTDVPTEYSAYTPGYYAVFFDDPITGIHFELSHTPMIPSISAIRRWLGELKQVWRAHPEWEEPPWKKAMRPLPGKGRDRS